MSTLQKVLNDAVQAEDVPFGVAMVGDKGRVTWSMLSKKEVAVGCEY